MSFTSTLTNQAYTENGALTNKSSESAVLDLFSMGVSSTNKYDLIETAMFEDPLLAGKAALYLRDVREGQGNRDILRALFQYFADGTKLTHMVKRIIKHLPEIGRWKDVIELLESPNKQIRKWALKLIIKHYHKGTDGLLFKWLPRQGAAAKLIIAKLDIDHGEYRRYIVSKSTTVEQQMCAKQWESINYSHVPSVANKKYASAFLRNDESRRREFLSSATKGEVKINSSVLYPHDIVNMVKLGFPSWKSYQVKMNEDTDTANALWFQLPNYMEQAHNVLPIIDTSGSMFTPATGTSAKVIDIAVALGIYFAEHNTGEYKDLWMNFSTEPQAYKLKGSTLSERISNLDYKNWGMSTDINKAFDFVLRAAKQNPESAPNMILIISDMEFNSCVKPLTNYEHIKQQFAELGVDMPVLVFWRVNVKSTIQPVTMNDTGTVLINGYSPSIMKELLAGDMTNYNPYQVMRKVLDSKYTWLKE